MIHGNLTSKADTISRSRIGDFLLVEATGTTDIDNHTEENRYLWPSGDTSRGRFVYSWYSAPRPKDRRRGNYTIKTIPTALSANQFGSRFSFGTEEGYTLPENYNSTLRSFQSVVLIVCTEPMTDTEQVTYCMHNGSKGTLSSITELSDCMLECGVGKPMISLLH